MPDREPLLAARYRALLEMAGFATAERDPVALFEGLAERLRAVAWFDLLAVALHDPARNVFRYRVYGAGEQAGSPVALETYVEEAPAGVVWSTRRPWTRADIDLEPRGARFLSLLSRAGMRSVCVLPLTAGDLRLGILALAGREAHGYPDSEIEFLELAAAQVAASAGHALAFREIAESREKLDRERRYLEEEIGAEYDGAEAVCESAAWKRVMREVETVARTDSTVLIRCEAGCGAELVARALHRRSLRSGRPFVKANCAEPDPALLESELFGGGGRVARVELADGGTLFLDHIGSLPPGMQLRLLRILQDRGFDCAVRRRRIPVDLRLVAAGTRDLAPLVAARAFRSDLFYRINVFPLRLPPLRERPEDIPPLVRHFIGRFARRMDRPVAAIQPETLKELGRLPWPGNVRELENLVERAMLVSPGPELRIAGYALPEPAGTMEDAQRAHILRALEASRWRVGGPGGAAARLGMKRTTLQSRMRKLGIARRASSAIAG